MLWITQAAKDFAGWLRRATRGKDAGFRKEDLKG